MGQYHVTVNLDKKEFLYPHKLGDGLKLREQSYGQHGIGAALILLLAASNGRGGGDFSAESSDVVGRWAGDRLAIVGDYAEPGDLAPEHKAAEIYRHTLGAEKRPTGGWKDISAKVARAIARENGVRYTGTGWKHAENADGSPKAGAKLVPDAVIRFG